jgi:hypothetical protein
VNKVARGFSAGEGTINIDSDGHVKSCSFDELSIVKYPANKKALITKYYYDDEEE